MEPKNDPLRIGSRTRDQIDNRSWRIGTRTIWAVCVGAGVAAFFIYGVGGPTAVGDQLLGAVVYAVVFIPLCRITGIPAAQPYVELNRSGIRYGKRQFVPWEAVQRVDWARRGIDFKKRLVVRTSGWKASGPLRFLIKRTPLPLSGLDTRKDAEDWLEPFRFYAPQIPLPPMTGNK